MLLVEDDPTNQLVGTTLLSARRHDAVVARDGLEALEKLKSQAFDLVLMDIRLPDMDGLAALKAIRNGEAGPDNARVPVVAITAHAVKEDRQAFLEAGMNGYIAKPYTKEELYAVLDTVMAGQRPT